MVSSSSSVLAELEELRSLLDQSPTKTFRPFTQLQAGTASTLGAARGNPVQPYNQALNVAETSVDRLGKAIEAAEEEMEAALKRTTKVHQSQLQQKEVELAELQRLLHSKERSIDSLRDTLATTKRSFEARVSQAESALSLKEAECVSLREHLYGSQSEKETICSQLQRRVAMLEKELNEARTREAALLEDAQTRAEESMRAQAALRSERGDASKHQAQIQELRRLLDQASDELRLVRLESRSEKERLEAEVARLQERLHAEKGVRKACEKWLRSELKSREEMEMLLTAVKDAAVGKSSVGIGLEDLAGLESLDLHGHNKDARDIMLLLDGLKLADAGAAQPQQHTALRHGSPGKLGVGRHGNAGLLPGFTSHSSVAALQAQGKQILEDNRKLQSDLAVAKKLLSNKLRS